MAHAAEPDEGNLCHALIHILDRARRGAERALRQGRGHETSISPSSTPACCEVCTPVRRSFTIWYGCST